MLLAKQIETLPLFRQGAGCILVIFLSVFTSGGCRVGLSRTAAASAGECLSFVLVTGAFWREASFCKRHVEAACCFYNGEPNGREAHMRFPARPPTS